MKAVTDWLTLYILQFGLAQLFTGGIVAGEVEFLREARDALGLNPNLPPEHASRGSILEALQGEAMHLGIAPADAEFDVTARIRRTEEINNELQASMDAQLHADVAQVCRLLNVKRKRRTA